MQTLNEMTTVHNTAAVGDIKTYMTGVGQTARAAAIEMAKSGAGARNAALLAAADALLAASDAIEIGRAHV